MKFIIVIANPSKKESLLEKLRQADVNRLTVSVARGYGSNTVHTQSYRGQKYTVQDEERLRIEMAVNDEYVETVIDIVEKEAVNDEKGGGKIFIMPLEEVVRARTGERGTTAIG